jgi:hypothetical protein
MSDRYAAQGGVTCIGWLPVCARCVCALIHSSAPEALGDALERPQIGRHLRHRQVGLPRIAHGVAAGPVVAVDEDGGRPELHVLLEHRDGALEPLGGEVVIGVGLDHPVLDHVGADLVAILEAVAQGDVVEQRVVPRLHVLERLPERHVQHVLVAHEVVEADLHQAGGLADAGARHDHPQVALPEPTMDGLLEDPQRAMLVHVFGVHAHELLRSRYFLPAAALFFSLCFSTSSSAMLAGTWR